MVIDEFIVNNGRYTVSGMRYSMENGVGKPLVMCHDYMSNQKKLKKYASYFCEHGYIVYTFDYCGGARGGKSEGDGDYFTLDHAILDLESVIHYVKENKNELALFGESFGGFLALLYAQKNPAVVAKCFCVSPLLSICDDCRLGKMLGMKFDPKDIKNTFKPPLFTKANYELAEDIIRYDEVKILKEVLCPVCMVFGGKDTLVPPKYGRLALESLSRDSYVYFIKKAKHKFKASEIDEANEHFREFMKPRQ